MSATRPGPMILFLLTLCTSASAEIKKSNVSKTSLTEHIEHLASDALGGRGVGSEGIAQAADYIAKAFEDCGLKPGGDNNSYFQTFDIPISKKITDACSLRISGHDQPLRVDVDYRPMPFSTNDQFKGDVVFVGYGITNEEKKHNDYASVNVEGKVALIVRYEPKDWTGSSGQHSSAAWFATKIALAKKHGAVGVLIVNPPSEDDDTLYEFRTGRRVQTFALPVFHVSRDLADTLLQQGGLDTLATLNPKMNRGEHVSAPLPSVHAHGDPGIEEIMVQARNVIGILRGEGDLAHEHIAIGAHYDHLGNVPPTMMPMVGREFDSAAAEIHNGADDNASGTAGVVELARVYGSGPTPKRSLIFLAFSAEEMGLLGSAYYATHPIVPLKNTVAMMNLDMIGRLNDRTLQVIGSQSAAEFEAILKAHGETLGLELKLSPGLGLGGSDHMSFYEHDIPFLFPFSGLHRDYHKPTDDSDKIDFEGATKITQLVKAVTDDVIALEHRPTFKKVKEQRSLGRNRVKVRMGIRPSYGGDEKQAGWKVEGVLDGGPADRAGMKDGDWIMTISAKPINSIYDYMSLMEQYAPGDTIDVVVRRGEKEVTLKLTLEGK